MRAGLDRPSSRISSGTCSAIASASAAETRSATGWPARARSGGWPPPTPSATRPAPPRRREGSVVTGSSQSDGHPQRLDGVARGVRRRRSGHPWSCTDLAGGVLREVPVHRAGAAGAFIICCTWAIAIGSCAGSRCDAQRRPDRLLQPAEVGRVELAGAQPPHQLLDRLAVLAVAGRLRWLGHLIAPARWSVLCCVVRCVAVGRLAANHGASPSRLHDDDGALHPANTRGGVVGSHPEPGRRGVRPGRTRSARAAGRGRRPAEASRTGVVAVTNAASPAGEVLLALLRDDPERATRWSPSTPGAGRTSGVTWRLGRPRGPRRGRAPARGRRRGAPGPAATTSTPRSGSARAGARGCCARRRRSPTAAAAAGARHLVVVTSAMVYGAAPDAPGPRARGRRPGGRAGRRGGRRRARGRGGRRPCAHLAPRAARSPACRPAALVGPGRRHRHHPALRGAAAAGAARRPDGLAVLPRRGPRVRRPSPSCASGSRARSPSGRRGR